MVIIHALAVAMDVDVMIIGAGPTGLMLALELSLQRTSFRIIDKAIDRSDKSRALIVQPRSLELFSRHDGLAENFISTGMGGVGVDVYVNKSLATRIDLQDAGLTDTAFPLPLWISQADTERLLEERLIAYGHQVERGVRAEDIRQGENGVSVKHNRPAGDENVRCRYLIGCDGAHSIVRRSPGFTFEGGVYPQAFFLCDTRVDWDYPRDRMIMFWGRNLLGAFPINGEITRLVGSLGTTDAARDPTLEDFQELVSKLVKGPVKLHDPTWLTRFQLHHRVVNNYRDGCLFVAGDAAHIHTPVGGQGMNTGIQDAVNLGWKLAAVIRGERSGEYLDSYDTERRPIGEYLLKSTDRIFTYATSTNVFFVFLRNFFFRWIFPIITRSRGSRTAASGFMSQFRIRYRRSPIVQTATDFRGRSTQAGDRASDGKIKEPSGQKRMLLELCRGPSYHLLLFSGLSSAAVGEDKLQAAVIPLLGRLPTGTMTHLICTEGVASNTGYVDVDGFLHRRYGFDSPGYVLVRPDCHVEHIGLLSSTDEVLSWLDSSA